MATRLETFHYGVPGRAVTEVRHELRFDYLTRMPRIMPRLVLDVPPIASGFCYRCDRPVMTIRCAWPDGEGGYADEHTIIVHMDDGSTHQEADAPKGVMTNSLFTRSVCPKCGHHGQDQFRTIFHPYHDESICRTCGYSVHGGDIGD